MYDSRGSNEGAGVATAFEVQKESNHRLFNEDQQIFFDENGQKCLFLAGGRSFFHGRWLITKPRVLGILPKETLPHPKFDVRNQHRHT